VTTSPAPDVASDPAWRPTVDDVAALIRARTKDPSGRELGTFTSETRPSDDQVEKLITNGCAKVASFVGWELPDDAWPEAGHLASLVAACEAELSYYPEQVQTGRSAYAELWAMYQYDVGQFADYVAQIAPTSPVAARSGSIATPSGTVVFAYEMGYGVWPLGDVVGNVGH